MYDDAATKSPLELRLAELLEKRRQESRLRVLTASPEGSIDLSSNDFLSLSTCPELRNRFSHELGKCVPQLGSTGSRLLDGNNAYSEELEREIALFHGAQAGLLANSGFDANVGIFSCLPQPGDLIVYDDLIHASVYDGIRLSRASHSLSFNHNSIEDLQKKLNRAISQNPTLRKGESNCFIAVESVYSMEGDLAPLPGIVEITEQLFPLRNCHIIVDEAHATGIYGQLGKGRVSELGLESKIFIRLHTFGKALACNGAIILSSPLTRLYLINYARPLIFTTFMSYPSLAAIKASYSFLRDGKTEALAIKLFTLTRSLYFQLQQIQCLRQSLNLGVDVLSIPKSCPESPIFAIFTDRPRNLAKYCQDAGFVVRAVVPPTVPLGTNRVRLCLHAGNTEKDVEAVIKVVTRWLQAQAVEQRPPNPRAML